MRKIYTIILSVFLMVNAYGLTYELKAGLSPDFLTNDGLYFNVAVEAYGDQLSIVQPGIGVIFAQFAADADAGGDVSAGLSTRFDKLPVYGIARFNLLGIGSSVLFVKGFGGWQFINNDSIKNKGGLYYGYGGGFDISRFSIEYFITKENYEYKSGAVHNGTFGTLGLGFKF